ncbi:MAG: metallophosphoesterase family protein [Clostridium sp.]
MNAITIAHLSDIHHNPDENSQISTLLREKGLLVEKLLGQCLETPKQRKPDIVLITGDMTHEGTSSHYRYLHDALSSALPGTPVLCAMGNHDVRGAFREGFLGLTPSGGPYYASASVKGWLFVSLDSAFEKGLEGVLTKEAMDFLENSMEAAGKSGPGSSDGAGNHSFNAPPHPEGRRTHGAYGRSPSPPAAGKRPHRRHVQRPRPRQLYGNRLRRSPVHG